MRAKTLSLIAKTIAVLYALIASIFLDMSVVDIVIIASFIAESFITVDISLITKNVKQKEPYEPI